MSKGRDPPFEANGPLGKLACTCTRSRSLAAKRTLTVSIRSTIVMMNNVFPTPYMAWYYRFPYQNCAACLIWKMSLPTSGRCLIEDKAE
jgi:hypothetical protein